jgi:mannosyl-oligosaccharide alpha-1,2-mannosidase
MAGPFDSPLRLVWKRRVKGNPLLVAVCVCLLLYATYLLPVLRAPDSRAPRLFAGFGGGPARRCAAYSSRYPYKPPQNITHSPWRRLALKNPPGELRQLRPDTPKRLAQVQFAFSEHNERGRPQKERRDAVKATFLRAWTSYKEKAWLKDEVLPISGGFKNNFGGWGATLVDSLGTLWILGMKDEFHQAVEAALTIDFMDPSKMEGDEISVFETTIRFLGGFLSAYEIAGCEDTRVLDKAIEVADMLYIAFDNPRSTTSSKTSPTPEHSRASPP